MIYRIGAELVLTVHVLFVLFVVLGGLLVLRWSRVAPWHIAAALWGAVVELTGLVCPLTYLELDLLRLGGESGYGGGCLDHYLTEVLYPAGLTRATQVGLGVAVLSGNLLLYGYLLWRRRSHRRG